MLAEITKCALSDGGAGERTFALCVVLVSLTAVFVTAQLRH